MNITPRNTTFRPRESFLPNPKAKLREQLHEVMRFKQFSLRTEGAYWNWIRRYVKFHGMKSRGELAEGKVKVEARYEH